MKRKAPKLVVDNAPPHDCADDESGLPYQELVSEANRIFETKRRFPELDPLFKRAVDDQALLTALTQFAFTYWCFKDYETKERRKKLKLERRQLLNARDQEIYARLQAGETHKAIGLAYKISVTRVRQIVDKAIRQDKMRARVT